MDQLAKMSKLGFFPASNSSSNSTSSFPAGMMDSFLISAGNASPPMQLLLFVYRLLGAQFGLDPSILLTILGFVWGLSKLLSQVYTYVWALISRYLMCAMYISERDEIYIHLMKFLSLQQSITNNRYLSAQTVWKSAWEEEEDIVNSVLFLNGVDKDDDGDGNSEDGESKYLNFANQAARSSPRFVPAMGTTGFWHNGTYFRINRKKESYMNTSGWSAMKDLEEIRLSCFGRSIAPLKQLLANAKTAYYLDTRQKTTIYRPRAKEHRREGNLWQQVARRPVRPMRTVVLDSKEKKDILRDINEYLHPATPAWYASRGIPLRRGYLFHGPPGTGKTSFSFALAGVFGINIYVISLQDVNVTEEDLAILFTKLPRRCIVLLEDIDTAGLRRAPDAEVEEDKDKEKEKEKEKDASAESKDKEKEKEKDGNTETKDKQVDIAEKSEETKAEKKAKKKEKKKAAESDSDSSSSDDSSDEEKKKRRRRRRIRRTRGPRHGPVSVETISLSGLLNAIDGVASHEGRVLIMTTNKPESLDEALIRPGRVDMQVGFMNASSTQASELFHRMYEASRIKAAAARSEMQKLKRDDERQKILQKNEVVDITAEELKEIAQEFGKLIPEDTFSPAEIQGFLLKRKKFPRKALEDAGPWIEAALRQKENKSKIVTVQ